MFCIPRKNTPFHKPIRLLINFNHFEFSFSLIKSNLKIDPGAPIIQSKREGESGMVPIEFTAIKILG
ncbi:hypothetical protein APR41_02940 [Salegentibacter salinarum]|uniref:Uncharacterized protein n=1 Tax=Salegentibacter salinarum TaxID=447422 RepID=A0A2N0TXV4_9FLAO|nr:hypothetical protein APR41_02940 [Salegentibacter salinarum]